MFQYTVKFVCGKSDGKLVAPGTYWTAVNVHNSGKERVSFHKQICLALPSEKPGPVTKPFDAVLGPNEAFEIDNRDIFHHLDHPGEFVKGFVVMDSPVELDVVSVYTAAGSTGQVETLFLERAPVRRTRDLEADLVPVPGPNNNFCKRNARGDLLVTVKNQGPGPAGPCVTRVDFGRFGQVDKPTPALAAGATVDIAFPIPLGAFDPDCEFQIIVDVNNQVSESAEGNNRGNGTCIG